MINKNAIKKITVAEVLRLIYHYELAATALQHKSKEDLQYFIMDIFDKGILNDYLRLKAD